MKKPESEFEEVLPTLLLGYLVMKNNSKSFLVNFPLTEDVYKIPYMNGSNYLYK